MELLRRARTWPQRVVRRRREGDVVRATVDPVRAELCFLRKGGDHALEPAQRVAHPDEPPVRGGDDARGAFCGEDLAHGAVPARSRELRSDLVFFLGRQEDDSPPVSRKMSARCRAETGHAVREEAGAQRRKAHLPVSGVRSRLAMIVAQ